MVSRVGREVASKTGLLMHVEGLLLLLYHAKLPSSVPEAYQLLMQPYAGYSFGALS